MALVKWHGHSCFEVRGPPSILIDPHDGKSLGLPAPDVVPNIVLISHPHDDHANGRHLFEGSGTLVLDEPCEAAVKGAYVLGIGAYHDDVKGARLGKNVVFVFEVEGVRFVHLGDLGHHLNNKQLHKMGDVDVLFVGAGIDFERTREFIASVQPRVAVPMHYNVEGLIFPYFQLAEVDDFVECWENVRRIDGPEAVYIKNELPSETRIDVFRLR
jgi:L-ascorbate metabolism protein UlaG (beta-lactamase superfamily)